MRVLDISLMKIVCSYIIRESDVVHVACVCKKFRDVADGIQYFTVPLKLGDDPRCLIKRPNKTEYIYTS